MLKRPVLSLITAFALCSCAGVESEPGPKGCKEGGQRAPKVKVVNINFTPDPMVVAPKTICARPGDVLKFKFNGNPGADLKVESKTNGVVWLDGGGQTKWFYVLIPWHTVATTEQVFEYKVTLGGKVLDPEVRVKNNYN